MEVEMKMPDLATTGSPIKVLRWLVEPGQTIQRGEPILEVETDKAVMEVESVLSGRLIARSASEGDEVEAGAPIARFESNQTAAALPEKEAERPSAAAQPPSPHPQPARVSGADSKSARISFFARNAEARARSRGGRTFALSVPQRVMAKRMEESKRTVPHFYLQTSANAEAMVTRRKALGEPALSWDAFFVRAAATALRQFERLACRIDGDQLVSLDTEAVGVAVDLDGELFTIAIERPADRALQDISREIVQKAEGLRSGDPRARLTQPTAFTISNLGSSGVESFVAVINPPESAILAVGKVMPVVTPVQGMIAIQNRVQLTLSVDHRVVSGKYAADFLAAIVRQIETY